MLSLSATSATLCSGPEYMGTYGEQRPRVNFILWESLKRVNGVVLSYGFDYFVRFGTAAGPDHATMPRLRYLSGLLWVQETVVLP